MDVVVGNGVIPGVGEAATVEDTKGVDTSRSKAAQEVISRIPTNMMKMNGRIFI